MACCGGGRRTILRSQTYQSNGGRGGTYAMGAGMTGSKGMVLIEYQRSNVGEESYPGAFTGSLYTFSAKKKQRWVDQRDLSVEARDGKRIGLLDLVEGSRSIFKLVRQPIAEKIAEVTEIADEMTSEATTDDISAELSQETVPEDLGDLTVIKGVGKSTAKKLIARGYYSVRQILEADSENLMEDLGWSEEKVLDLQIEAGKQLAS